MLVETLIQNTLEMQGFRVAEVTFVNGSLEAEIVPDRSGPTRLNSILRFLSGISADFYAASSTVGSITV